MSKKWILGGALAAFQVGKFALKHQRKKTTKAQLPGQIVVITGASSGIGEAYAHTFAKVGCHLVLAARRVEKLEALAQTLREQYHISVLVSPTDVADPVQAKAMIAAAEAHFGKIDILINNAGIATFSYFHKDNFEQMRQVMEVNYWGALHCTHAALPGMMTRKSGRIVNIASTASKIAPPGIGNYAATKHALRGFSDGLRVEVAKYGIQVQVICPTSTKTDIVKSSGNQRAVNFNPDNFFGMSVKRVARETLNAIYSNTPELMIGNVEKIGVQLKYFSPKSIDVILKTFGRLAFKE